MMRNPTVITADRRSSARILSISDNGFLAARQFPALRYFFYAFFFTPVLIRETCF